MPTTLVSHSPHPLLTIRRPDNCFDGPAAVNASKTYGKTYCQRHTFPTKGLFGKVFALMVLLKISTRDGESPRAFVGLHPIISVMDSGGFATAKYV